MLNNLNKKELLTTVLQLIGLAVTILIIMMIGQLSQLTQSHSDMYLQTHDGWKNAAPENAALIVAYREECIDKNKASKQPLVDKEAEVNCAKKNGRLSVVSSIARPPKVKRTVAIETLY